MLEVASSVIPYGFMITPVYPETLFQSLRLLF